MIKRHSSKLLMEECQNVDKIINDAAKSSHVAESPNVKSNDDGVVINKSDKQSIDPQTICQENALPESSVATDQSRQGRGSKRKLDDLEDRSTTTDLEISNQQNQWRMTKAIKPRIKDTPTISTLEKTARNRIRNGRMTMEGRPFSRRHVSSPKYASFLRMYRKEEVDELRSNSSSRRDDGEKLQRRRGLSTESTGYDRANPQIERRIPTPRSTVHTTYNPIMHSSATDPILDSSGLTIQLLRLAVLLYAPALMPALNSLIAQQNQQTPSSSSFERSNDLLTQIFRLLNEQQSIYNLPFVPHESERESSTLAAETNTESSQTHSEQKEKDISITTKESAFSLKQESISAGTSRWNSNNHVQKQEERDREWRLTSMLTDSDVRLDRNIFAMEDFRKFKEFLKTEKKRSEDVRSLSTRNKNEIVMKEYFRNWLHRLLQQLNSASSNLSVNDQKAKYSEGSSGNTSESPLEEVKEQGNMDRLIVEESLDSLKDDRNIFTKYEEEDSDDQRSFTSATSTNSSRSLQLKQSDARKTESRNENLQD
ncbi:uncharacterized protein LOC115243648 [Formica exsecta]|uniref:uncharacterized protein LOC115243648 n=1 Tax=Formica exsecta TaxID=72781 RepID=UPI0011450821|nr:uncharacterized protein LOC115243648 [Formica exsecta]